MSRGVFNSQNKVGEVLYFKTTSDSGSTFNPLVAFTSGSDRVSWDIGLNTGYTAANTISIVYSDAGTVKNCEIRTNRLSRLSQLNFFEDDIYGELDLTNFYELTSFSAQGCPQLSAVTHSYSPTNLTSYSLSQCNITGEHDLSMLNIGGNFQINTNPNLTGLTHTASTQTVNQYFANSCNLTGNHDLSMFPKLGGDFRNDICRAPAGALQISPPNLFNR